MEWFFLFLAGNKLVKRLLLKYGHRLGVNRFIAGDSFKSALPVIKSLNNKGFSVTVDYLGEFINSEEEAMKATNECIHAIQTIAKERLDSEVSVKLTSIGLDISDLLTIENMREILREGKKYSIMITIDMEDYARYEQTIAIYKQLKQEFHQIGTVLQAYLYRTEKDMTVLNQDNPYLRLVKGAYKESSEIAFPKKTAVDRNFMKLIKVQLLAGHYTAIATHDEKVINYTIELVNKNKLANDQFEFQLLYGIRQGLQERLVKQGYQVRVYVPYGEDWYGYNLRRLAERPANVWFVLKSLFKK